MTILKTELAKLVIGDLVLKVKLVLILTVLKVKFDCMLYQGVGLSATLSKKCFFGKITWETPIVRRCERLSVV